jgi:two-component system, NarL family, sensor histidine kinase BarA
MDTNPLPVIDWELGTKLAGNKREAAEEMLDMMVKSLPDDISAIKKNHAAQNYPELLRQVHRLHGALCYCGLPRLKIVTSRLEIDLKSHIIFSLPSLLDQLDTEVHLLLEHYSRLQL